MTANAPIDIADEVGRLEFEEQDDTIKVYKLCSSIAERVEAQTIERCLAEYYENDWPKIKHIPRLYAPKSDKEEEK